MNPEMPIDPRQELEAKLTALLLGELATEEAAGLRRAMAQDAELAKTYARLKLTVELVREAAREPAEQTAAQPAPLRLSEERRQELFQHFKTVAPKDFTRQQRREMPWLVPMAAAAALVAIIASIALPTLRSGTSFSRMAPEGDSPQQEVALGTRVWHSEPPSGSLSLELRGRSTAVESARESEKHARNAAAAPVQNEGAVFFHRIPGYADGRKQESTLDGNAVAATPETHNYFGLNFGQGGGGKQVEPSLPALPAPRSGGSGIILPSNDNWADAAKPSQAGEVAANLGYPAAAGDLTVDYSLQSRGDHPSKGVAVSGSARLQAEAGGTTAATLSPDLSRGFAVNKTEAGSPAHQWDAFGATMGKTANQPALSPPAKPEESGFGRKVPQQKPVPETTLFAGNYAGRPYYAEDEVAAKSSQPVNDGISLGTTLFPRERFRSEHMGDAVSFGTAREKARVAQSPATQPAREPPAMRAGAYEWSVNGDGLRHTLKQEPEQLARNRGEEGEAGSSKAPVLGDLPKVGQFFRLADGKGNNQSEAKNKAAGDGWIADGEIANGKEFSAGFPLAYSDSLNGATTPKALDRIDLWNFDSALSQADYDRLNLGSEARFKDALKNRDVASRKALASVEAVTALPPQKADQAQVKESDAPPRAKLSAPAPEPQPEIHTHENPFSTFSLNVSDVSLKLAAASLEKGVMPEPATIRSEEFINAFDYGDPEPPAGVPVAFAWERAAYPFAHNRDLLRFSIKTAAAGRQPGRPLNLVLLLDNSGSMERADRVRIIHEALRVLATQLQAQDRFSVVTFARTARLWVDGVPGNEAAKAAEEVGSLTPAGGTNLEEAMNLAYQTAQRHYVAGGINRVVLLTDGAANLGTVAPETLKQKVETNRRQGIALDCFGIGWEGYNDDLLEVLSRNGDGRYGFVNTPEEAATEFAGQLAGALRVAASDVKVQVEFNPARVTAYRQIGYAKHQLTKEQFRDNTVDAAEIGAAESGNALYAIEVNPRGDGPLGIVRVRYKVPGTAEYREQEWAVPYSGNAAGLEQASPAMRLAATASAFSEWLASSPYAGEVTPDRLLGCLSGVPDVYGADGRPKKLEWMIRQAKSLGK